MKSGKLSLRTLARQKATGFGSSKGYTDYSHGSKLDLVRISCETQSTKVIEELNNLGFKYTAEDITTKLDKLTARVLNKLTDSALDAIKSKVPVLGLDLRNNHIKATGSPYSGAHTPGRFKSGSSTKLSRDVYVDNAKHVAIGYKSSDNLTAAGLAALKDQLPQRRSRDSIAVDPYSDEKGRPTRGVSKNWISKAQKEFTLKVPYIIAKVVNK